MQVTDRDDDDEGDVNCDQETRVPPSTPIHTVRPKNAAYAFPGMQVNAVLAAGSMKAAVSPSGTFLSFSASSAPTKPAVSFADERAPSHDRKRSRRALQDDSAIEDIMSQSKSRQPPAAHHLLTPPRRTFSHNENQFAVNGIHILSTGEHIGVSGSFGLRP